MTNKELRHSSLLLAIWCIQLSRALCSADAQSETESEAESESHLSAIEIVEYLGKMKANDALEEGYIKSSFRSLLDQLPEIASLAKIEFKGSSDRELVACVMTLRKILTQ